MLGSSKPKGRPTTQRSSRCTATCELSPEKRKDNMLCSNTPESLRNQLGRTSWRQHGIWRALASLIHNRSYRRLVWRRESPVPSSPPPFSPFSHSLELRVVISIGRQVPAGTETPGLVFPRLYEAGKPTLLKRGSSWLHVISDIFPQLRTHSGNSCPPPPFASSLRSFLRNTCGWNLRQEKKGRSLTVTAH